MPNKNEDGTILLSADEAKAYETAQVTITELQGKVTTLEAEVAKTKTTEEPKLPEEVRIRLERAEQEAISLRTRLVGAEVDAILERARNFVDGSKRKHAPVLLEWAEALLRGKPLGKDGVIKLEKADSVGSVVEYVHAAVKFLLENVPGSVLVEGNTEDDETRKLESGKKKEYSKEDYAAFWGTPAKKEGA
jgi:hypothetical protein